MKLMKALVYDRPSVCTVRELPLPECGDDEVVIKVMAASICKGADRRHHTTGHKLGRYPITTGHEFAGYVYQVGRQVRGFRVSDRVTADNAVPCGGCYFCKREMYTHCENFMSVGHSIPGGFAQYLKVKANSVFHLPEGLSFNEGCLTEPVACCVNAVKRLNVQYGEDVLVFGAGPNGIILAQLLQHSNAGRVVSLAPTKFKLDLLNSYGIETIQIDQAAPEKHVKEVFARFPYGVDAIVDATGSASVLPGCFRLLKKRGRLLQFSSTKDDEDITINPAYFYRNELHYYTCAWQVHQFGAALEAMASGKVKLDRLVTKQYPLEEFPQAIEDVLDRNVLKLVIRPNGMED